MKTCKRCTVALPDDAFAMVDGYRRGECKACRTQYMRAYYAEHRTALRAANSARSKKDRDGCRARYLKWVAAHPEQARETSKQRWLQWAEANPDKRLAGCVAAANRRRGWKLAAVGTMSTADLAALRQMASGVCAYCLEPNEKLAVDHVIALSRGGGNSIDDCVMACKSCNSRKREFGVLSMLDARWRLKAA